LQGIADKLITDRNTDLVKNICMGSWTLDFQLCVIFLDEGQSPETLCLSSAFYHSKSYMWSTQMYNTISKNVTLITLLKVPSHQIRLGLKYNVWIGLGKYKDRRW
jgi:hypothetical protein